MAAGEKVNVGTRGRSVRTAEKKRLARQAVLVLGMHRSGTSALAGVIARLGAKAPKTLMPATPSNPRGHWESDSLMKLHDRLLASAGTNWHDWAPFNPDWSGSATAAAFATELKQEILEEFGDAPLFVVKDPRICRFTPYWLQQLADLGVGAGAVLIVRNPLEVAASLKKRNNFSVTASLLLWLRHVLDAEFATREIPRVIVRYSDLVTDWRAVVERIGRDLGVHWPARSRSVDWQVEQFLDEQLRHHHASREDLLRHRAAFEWVRDAYVALDQLAAAEASNSADALSRLDLVRSAFDSSSAVFGTIVLEAVEEANQDKARAEKLESEKSLLSEVAKERDAQLAQLSEAVKEREGQLAQLKQAVAEREQKVAQLREVAEQRDVELAQLKQVAAEREQTAVQLREAVTGIEAQLAAISELASHREAQIRRLTDALASRDGQVAELRQNYDDCQRLIRTLSETAAAADQAKVSLQEELTQARALLAENAHRMHTLQQAERDLRATHDRLQKQAHARVQELATLTRILQDTERRLHEQAHAAEASRADADKLRAELQSLREVQARLEQKLATCTSELATLTKIAEAKDSDLQKYVESLGTARAEALSASKLVEAVKAECNNLRRENQRLTDEIAAREVRARQLESTLAGLRAQSSASAQSLERSNRELAVLAQLLAEKEAELESCHATLEREQSRTARLKASASWRITKPLRATAMLLQGKKAVSRVESRNYELIKRSGVFDETWYLTQYPDVATAGADPILHYLRFGAAEGRDPSPSFSTASYVAKTSVRDVNPLVHFLKTNK